MKRPKKYNQGSVTEGSCSFSILLTFLRNITNNLRTKPRADNAKSLSLMSIILAAYVARLFVQVLLIVIKNHAFRHLLDRRVPLLENIAI